MEQVKEQNKQKWANSKAFHLLEMPHNYTKSELAMELGISRPTLNERLNKGNWKKSEIIALGQL